MYCIESEKVMMKQDLKQTVCCSSSPHPSCKHAAVGPAKPNDRAVLCLEVSSEVSDQLSIVCHCLQSSKRD